MPIEILMPALSPTMTEGNIAKWVKKEGDIVKAGQVIAEIETDKATMEVEAVDEGVLGKILIKEGTQGVLVNTAIALLLLEGEDKKVLDNYMVKEEVAKEKKNLSAVNEGGVGERLPQEVSSNQAFEKSENKKFSDSTPILEASTLLTSTRLRGEGPSFSSQRSRKVSPLAKRIAREASIDISQIQGSGPHGRVVRKDIEQARQGSGSGRIIRHQIEAFSVPNNTMRKVIAKRLLESKQYVPHFYLNIDCDIGKLLEARKDLNDAAQIIESKPIYKISVNDMIIKAVAKALKKVPAANASWTDEAIIMYNNIDISVAVAIEGGLITPIVKNADQKSLPTISNEMKDLGARAKAGKLSPHEFQGGGFSISNLGMYGIKNFNAIINPPQSCILAVGAGEERVIARNGKIEIANMVTFTLSCDHRVVDGAVGAEFLSAFKGYIEKPITMVI